MQGYLCNILLLEEVALSSQQRSQSAQKQTASLDKRNPAVSRIDCRFSNYAFTVDHLRCFTTKGALPIKCINHIRD